MDFVWFLLIAILSGVFAGMGMGGGLQCALHHTFAFFAERYYQSYGARFLIRTERISRARNLYRSRPHFRYSALFAP